MDLTKLAIQRNRVTVVALIVLLFAGLSTYARLPRAEDPGFIIRVATVTTFFPGASPRRVEDLVTDKLEKKLQEIPEVDFLRSESKTGFSLVFVNIQERYKEMRPIWDNLRRKVDDVRGELPEGIVGPFVNDEYGDVFGTVVMLTGEGYSYAELEDVAEEVRDELLFLDEVAKVDIIGEQDERVFVEYSNARLSEIGLSPAHLQRILSSRNIIIPGGSIDVDVERIALEPTGNFDSVEDLRDTTIQLPGSNELVRLRDIARVERGYVDPASQITHATGVPALALAINMREGGNIISLGEQVDALMGYLQTQYPIGIEFDFTARQAYFVDKKIADFVSSLGQSIGIVLLVMLATLGIRTGLVVASLIPMAMIASILMMSVFDIGLDQMSLASLIIALGLLVDNSIVMSESIMVSMGEGKRPVDAAIESANELKVPLLTSSLTTGASFLPIYLAESAVGEYTASIFKVVTITLLCSWLLALTMIPLFCIWFIKVKPREGGEAFDSGLYRIYRASLLWGLRHRLLSLLLVVGSFFGTMQLAGLLPNIFFPPNDKPIFTAKLSLPIGTGIETTERMVQEAERFMLDELDADDDLRNWMSFVGGGTPRFVLSYDPTPQKPEVGTLIVNTARYEDLPRLSRALEDWARTAYPDVIADVRPLPIGPPVAFPVEVRISGRDEGAVFALVDEVKAHLSENYPVKNVQDDWGPRSKKLRIEISQSRAQLAGLSSQDVAVSLQTSLSGLQTTEYREGDEVIPVMLRTEATQRSDLGELESLTIFSQSTGRTVPLKQVADAEVAFEPALILRRDRLKTVTVQASLEAGAEQQAIAIALAVQPYLDEIVDKAGVGFKYELGGEIEKSKDGNDSINAKLPIALFIIIILLVGQFNSIRRPLIILLTIPLGLIGVVLGLLGAGSYFGFMTLLGVVSLAGIVINNAIVLIERIDLEIRENGRSPQQAVIEAGQRRLRPILLTTATTVGGLVPLWMGGGPMWEPMAIAIIFGLLFATVLTLGVVPLLYAVLFRVSFDGFELGKASNS